MKFLAFIFGVAELAAMFWLGRTWDTAIWQTLVLIAIAGIVCGAFNRAFDKNSHG